MLTAQLVKLIILLAALFTLAIGLVRAQPYENEAARALLLPPSNCPAPCWQGIRPDDTSIEEAFALLRAHPWVAAIDQRLYDIYTANWRWSAQRPPLIQETNSNTLWFSSHGRVASVEIMTHIRLGDARLLLGRPAWTSRASLGSQMLQVADFYPQYHMIVFYSLPCPASVDALWRVEVGLLWQDISGVSGQAGDSLTGALLRC